MRVDPLTKLLLGVIASALVYLCVVLTPIGTPVTAQSRMGDPAPVVLVGWEGQDGRIYRLYDGSGGLPVFDASSAPFSIQGPVRGQVRPSR
jgi:hypothetical protein